jgi:hypothetical protein
MKQIQPLRESVTHRIVKTNPEGYVSGPNPTGIGHLFCYGPILIICNLDRNFEISTFLRRRLRPMARYEFTQFPPNEEYAQFDLDFHNFLPDPYGNLFALNHLGHLRRFPFFNKTESLQEKPKDEAQTNSRFYVNFDAALAIGTESECTLLTAEEELVWLGDVERTILFNDRLVSSSPGGYKCADQKQSGLFISSNLYAGTDDEGNSLIQHERTDLFGNAKRLVATCYFPEWGTINALAFDAIHNRLAFASSDRVGLVQLNTTENGKVIPGPIIWEQKSNFVTKYLAFYGDFLLAAGYEPTDKGEEDFAHLKGGGLSKMKLENGEIVLASELAVDLAWGNGATPIMIGPERNRLFGVDRKGNLFAWDVRTFEFETIFERPAVESTKILGAAHLARTPRRIYCGFNRGGFEIHVYTFNEEYERE